jgi:hypothetical protein
MPLISGLSSATISKYGYWERETYRGDKEREREGKYGQTDKRESQKSIQQTGIVLSKKDKPEKVPPTPNRARKASSNTTLTSSHPNHSAASPEQSHKHPCVQHPPTFSTTNIWYKQAAWPPWLQSRHWLRSEVPTGLSTNGLSACQQIGQASGAALQNSHLGLPWAFRARGLPQAPQARETLVSRGTFS